MHEELLVARVTLYVLAVWARSTRDLDTGTWSARPKFFFGTGLHVARTLDEVRVLP